MDKLIVTKRGDKVCTAVVSRGKISQLMLEPDGSQSLLGNIYVGKVQKVVHNINAAFIDIGDGCVGYFSLEELDKDARLKAGDELVVQVSREAVKTKAPVLSARLAFTGRYCVLTAGKNGIGFSTKISDNRYRVRVRGLLEEALGADRKSIGVIVRTNAPAAPDQALLEEYRVLREQYGRISEGAECRTCYSCLYKALPGYIAAIRDAYCGTLEEIITDNRKYHDELQDYLARYQQEDAEKLTFYEDKLLSLTKLYSLDSAMERALGKNVRLKSGGYLVIEPTEAMTVVDVNTGKYSGKKKMDETIFKINMEAADEIARQLRLRNLSGIIIVDFIDMEREEDKASLLGHLGEVVSRDPVRTTVVDMTKLNLVELTRKKVRKPLHEQIL